MSDEVRSAEGEPWWPEFVRDYGDVPLRELARRYDTNARRLRRAAQRAGLTTEPPSLRAIVHLLGKAPDAALAERIDVTTEVIAGARRRREIPGFVKESVAPPLTVDAPEPAPEPVEQPVETTPPPAPRRRPRVVHDDTVVVVRRTQERQRDEVPVERRAPRLPGAPGPELPAAPAAPRRRRRIVNTDARPEEPPAPTPAPRPARARPTSRHSVVRVITPTKPAATSKPAAEPKPPAAPKRAPAQVASTPVPEPRPEPVEARSAPLPKPPTSAPATPRVAPVAEPIPLRAPAEPEPVEPQLWWARVLVDGAEQDLVIEATDLAQAASVAETRGVVLRIELARSL